MVDADAEDGGPRLHRVIHPLHASAMSGWADQRLTTLSSLLATSS